jgi:hypothetical protein
VEAKVQRDGPQPSRLYLVCDHIPRNVQTSSPTHRCRIETSRKGAQIIPAIASPRNDPNQPHEQLSCYQLAFQCALARDISLHTPTDVCEDLSILRLDLARNLRSLLSAQVVSTRCVLRFGHCLKPGLVVDLGYLQATLYEADDPLHQNTYNQHQARVVIC